MEILLEQGLAPTNEIVPLIIKGASCDTQSPIRNLCLSLLKQLCHQKLAHVQLYLVSTLNLLVDCDKYLKAVLQSQFDGSQQSEEGVCEERGLFEQTLKIIQNESAALCKEFTLKMLKVFDSVPVEQSRTYVLIILTLVD